MLNQNKDTPFTESTMFSASSEFAPATDKRVYDRRGRLTVSLKEKISGWLEQAEMFPERYRNYDPNAYSVEEWETYLRRKNNDLNFEQLLRRRRWAIKTWSERNLDEFMEKLQEAEANSNEFLEEEELYYVYDLMAHLRALRLKITTADIAARDAFYKFGRASAEHKEAVKAFIEAEKLLRFCSKWKFISEAGAVPTDIHEKISEAILKEIESRKMRWKYGEKWDADRLRLVRAAKKYGALLPEHYAATL